MAYKKFELLDYSNDVMLKKFKKFYNSYIVQTYYSGSYDVWLINQVLSFSNLEDVITYRDKFIAELCEKYYVIWWFLWDLEQKFGQYRCHCYFWLSEKNFEKSSLNEHIIDDVELTFQVSIKRDILMSVYDKVYSQIIFVGSFSCQSCLVSKEIGGLNNCDHVVLQETINVSKQNELEKLFGVEVADSFEIKPNKIIDKKNLLFGCDSELLVQLEESHYENEIERNKRIEALRAEARKGLEDLDFLRAIVQWRTGRDANVLTEEIYYYFWTKYYGDFLKLVEKFYPCPLSEIPPKVDKKKLSSSQKVRVLARINPEMSFWICLSFLADQDLPWKDGIKFEEVEKFIFDDIYKYYYIHRKTRFYKESLEKYQFKRNFVLDLSTETSGSAVYDFGSNHMEFTLNVMRLHIRSKKDFSKRELSIEWVKSYDI